MEDQRSQKNNATTVLVDADIFVAWAKEDDANHTRATQIFHQLEDRPIVFFTSNYVFAEALTVVSQRVSHDTAIKLGSTIQSPNGSFQIKWITEEVEDLAFRIFIEQTSKNVSFVDCTNMALQEAHHIDYIFSFDGVYKKNGYRTIHDLIDGIG